jgi:cell division protease FtsH
VTMFLPEEDRLSYSRERLESQISSLFGGRIAEELIFGADFVTTGASNDIERATEIARNMVTKWGLSQKLGPMSYSEDEGEVFLGHSVTQHKSVSDETAHTIDEEVRLIVTRNYDRATAILDAELDKLHRMSEALMKFETIDSDQIDDIMAGKPPREPSDWMDDDSGGPPVAAEGDDVEKPETDGAIGGPASSH